jgi:hypothetical protein
MAPDRITRDCSHSFLMEHWDEIREICRREDWPIGKAIIALDELGPCLCYCYSLASGTLIESGTGELRPIETYEKGDEVMTAGRSLAWAPNAVVMSATSCGAGRHSFVILVTYRDTALAVTSDHLFLMANRSLKRADRLAPGDVLVSPRGEPVPISGVHIGDYLAGFHHVATSKEPPAPDLDGHLLNTNGIVSADYTVQLLARHNEAAGFSGEAMAALPVVGSPEYVEKFGQSSLQAPAFAAGFAQTGSIEAAPYNAPDLAGNVFVPAEATFVRVPPDACS